MTDVTTELVNPTISDTDNSQHHTAADSSVATYATSARMRAREGERPWWLPPTPKVITHTRPSLAESWRYAMTGEQCPPEGPARYVMWAWAFAQIPARALNAYIDWVLEHLSRVVVVWVLWAVLSMVFPQIPHPW